MEDKIRLMKTYEEAIARIEDKVIETELFELEGMTVVKAKNVYDVLILHVRDNQREGWVAISSADEGINIGLYDCGLSLSYEIDVFMEMGFITKHERDEHRTCSLKYRTLAQELRERASYEELHKKYGKGNRG